MDHVTQRDQITSTVPATLPSATAPRPWTVRDVFDAIGTVVAWLVIFAAAALLVYRNALPRPTGTGPGAAVVVGLEVQGRYIVGLDQLMKMSPGAATPKNQEKLLEAVDELNKKDATYAQRLRHAILLGELSGPEQASAALAALERQDDAGKVEADVAVLLRRLYKGYEEGVTEPAAILEPDELQQVRNGLGWYGALALAPKGGDEAAREAALTPALRTAIAYPAMLLLFVFGALNGLAIIVVLLVRLYRGTLRPAITTGGGRGGVYVETFALYLALFIGMSFVLRNVSLGPFDLLANLAIMFLSLAALVWPVLRGLSWARVREDVGLTFAGRPLFRLLMGLASYVAALPLLALVLLATVWLMRLLHKGQDDGPSHPIVGVALRKDWLMWVQVFLVAVVGAPIVEEIMFRGLLYRHLRELTGRSGLWLSILASVLTSGFVFAVIHPQGWLGVPALMTLATVFALAREFSRSLVPSMIAHGLNNGMTLLLLLLVAG